MVPSDWSRSPQYETVSVLVVGDNISLYHTLERASPEGVYAIEPVGFASGPLPRLETQPDLVLIDRSDEDEAISLIIQVKENYPDSKMILLTPHDRSDWLRRVTEKGVSYCIMRPVHAQTVVRRIIQVARPAAHRADALGGVRQMSYEQEVSKLLSELGVPNHFKGYAYLKTAIALALQDETVLRRITAGLYPQVAQIHGVSPIHVERSIRHAIEVTWMRGDMNLINSLFAYSINQDKGKPTNSLFIARLADHLRLEESAPPTA